MKENTVDISLGSRSLEIAEKDRRYMTTGLAPCTLYAPLVFERGEGSVLWDVDGKKYIDMAAGVLTNATGHCHPKVVHALTEQVNKLWHIHDFPCPDRYKLCEALLKWMPDDLDTFEFYSGGTETVEAAMRAAMSYNKGKSVFLSFNKCYHGKTLGSRTLIGNRSFGPILDGIHVPFAHCYRCEFGLSHPSCGLHCADYAEKALRMNKDVLAGVVVEPILGAGGVVVPPKGFLERIAETCCELGILLIADEVLTGIGRTGKFFAIEHYGIKPDLICSGKGLGSGFPVMALCGKKDIMTAEPYGAPGGASTSFGGNPLAVAAALATVDVIDQEKLLDNALKVGEYIRKRLDAMKEKHPLIGDVRGMGLLFGIELVKNRKTKEPAREEGKQVYMESINRGLKFLTTDELTRLSPPLNVPLSLTEEALDIYESALEAVEKQYGYV